MTTVRNHTSCWSRIKCGIDSGGDPDASELQNIQRLKYSTVSTEILKRTPENGAGKECNKSAVSKSPCGKLQGFIKLNQFRVFL
jgi:hypothetical protein